MNRALVALLLLAACETEPPRDVGAPPRSDAAAPTALTSGVGSASASAPDTADGGRPDPSAIVDAGPPPFVPAALPSQAPPLPPHVKAPFAVFAKKVHGRIHPHFSDGFLVSLSDVAPGSPLANMTLRAHAEIVLDGEGGAILQTGIVLGSGVAAFDEAVLSAIRAGAPFGKPPTPVLSADGRVYLRWEFHRDPYYACTDKFARLYLLKKK